MWSSLLDEVTLVHRSFPTPLYSLQRWVGETSAGDMRLWGPWALSLPFPPMSERAAAPGGLQEPRSEGTPLLLQCRAQCRLQKTKDTQTLQNQVQRLEGRIRAQPGAVFPSPSACLWLCPF